MKEPEYGTVDAIFTAGGMNGRTTHIGIRETAKYGPQIVVINEDGVRRLVAFIAEHMPEAMRVDARVKELEADNKLLAGEVEELENLCDTIQQNAVDTFDR